MDARRLATLLALAAVPDETFALLCWTIVVTAQSGRLGSGLTRDALMRMEPIALEYLGLLAADTPPRSP